ncbi:MAG: glycosyltransferase family 4 protein [Cyanothece sp. SIO2G6]|nr:glycosyltransferase family 4 protein [Cyanothece sp. SIO2G6]
MNIAYFVNQYPKVSHSFIRREIMGLEAAGYAVQRFALRSPTDQLVDPDDIAELEKTRLVLGNGILGLMIAFVMVAIARPVQWWKALLMSISLGLSSDSGLLKHLIALAEACVLFRWLQQDNIDHLHVHFGTNSTTVAFLCRQLGGPPYSFTVHGPEEFDRVNGIALTEKINQAAFVVAISSFGRSQLYRWCAYSQWSKIHIVRCGVDEQFLQATPVSIPDTPTLVCVGRLCEQKGQLLLLEAAHQLVQKQIPLNLVLVGDGELRSAVESRIEAYGLQEQVTITGWASGAEVQRYLNEARAFVLPSFAEGLPVVIMEALALGRPVISTYVAGIPELVAPGECGWLAIAGSVDELAQAMEAALTKPVGTLEAMGQVGAERVRSRHNAQTEAKVLAKLFQSQPVQA